MPDFFEEWKQRYSAEDLAGDADQTEWEAIRLGVTNVDTGIRDQILSGELETSSAREERSTRVTDEIERRSAILGDLYPFERTGNSLRYRPSDSHVYEFCLSISFVGSLSTTFGRRFQIGFERLTRDVMACLLGPCGDIVDVQAVGHDGLDEGMGCARYLPAQRRQHPGAVLAAAIDDRPAGTVPLVRPGVRPPRGR